MTTIDTFLTTIAKSDQPTFTHADVKAFYGVTGPKASSLIQAHLTAQETDGRVTNIFHRVSDTRTRNTIYAVGKLTADAKDLFNQLRSDIQTRIEGSIEPTFALIGARNPNARAIINFYNVQIQSMIASMEAALELAIIIPQQTVAA